MKIPCNVIQDLLPLFQGSPREYGVGGIHETVKVHEARHQEGERGDERGAEMFGQNGASQNGKKVPDYTENEADRRKAGRHQAARVLIPRPVRARQCGEHAETHEKGFYNSHGNAPL